MKMPQLLVLLATILLHAACGFPTGREKQASWDDVNVVAHGLLQLGQGLREHVEKTKSQMRDVGAKLKTFNGTVALLEKKQQEQQEALKGRGAGLAEEVRARLEEAKRQSQDINSRMDRLEDKVDAILTGPKVDSNYSEQWGTSFIQRLLAAQNQQIDDLVEKIKQQQGNLEKQSLHLQVLQSKMKQKRVKSYRRRDGETATRGEAELPKDTTEFSHHQQRQ